LITLDFGVTGLNQAVVAGLFSSFVSVQPQRNYPIHLIFPFLADYVQEAFRTNIVVRGGVVGCLLLILRQMLLGGRQVGSGRLLPVLQTFGERGSLLGLVHFSWNAIIIPHFLGNLHHIQILQRGAVFDAKLEVTFFVGDRVPVQG